MTLLFENIWWTLVLIGVMIMIHELGHYWAARYFDVRVETFSFGFGPRLFGFRRGETDFRFSAILFGGYVKMAGEQPGDENVNDPRSFQAKPRWQRLVIAFAGPFMNVILAVCLLTGLFMVRYPKMPVAFETGVVGMVTEGSPAARAGVREGDRIVSIDGVQNPSWEDVFRKEIGNAGLPLRVTVLRGGQEIDMTVTPVLDERTGVGSAGWAEQSEIQIANIVSGMDAEKQGLQRGDILISVNNQLIHSMQKLREVVKASEGAPVEIMYLRDGVRNKVVVEPKMSEIDGQKGWAIGVYLEPRIVMTKLGLVDAFRESVRHNVRSATLIYQFLRGIVERRMSAKSLEGPIRIGQLSGDAAREGPAAFVGLMAMVSLNLAIFNLLPIPVLDGGMILVLLVEMLIRKDLSLPVKETFQKLGFVFLMMVVVFVLYNDISKIMPAG